MASSTVPPVLRDRLITEFRRFLCDHINFVPFEHQADWWVTTDGYELTDSLADPESDEPSIQVCLPTGTIEQRRLVPRTAGRAKVVAELGAYKSGKSAGAGLWGAAFAAVPNALVYLVGNEYDMCAPEFDYILEALCSVLTLRSEEHNPSRAKKSMPTFTAKPTNSPASNASRPSHRI
jgi:hypothetical protein